VARLAGQKIEFLAGIFEEGPRAFMRFVHQAPDRGQVAGVQGFRRRGHTGVFPDDMPRPAPGRTVQAARRRRRVQQGRCGFAQLADPEDPRCFLALGPAFVVGAVGQRVLDPGLDDDEAGFAGNRDAPHLEGAAVEKDGLVARGEQRGHLVEQAAPHPGE
jgi:hypothetical protein